MQAFGESPFLGKRLPLPDLDPIAKFRTDLWIMTQNCCLEIIRFARQVPEMKSNRGTIALRLPVELFIVQIVRKTKNNLVNILETKENIVKSGSGHMNSNGNLRH